ncbi:hypothetical protein L9F63_006793, partial [Diploptera punctata]
YSYLIYHFLFKSQVRFHSSNAFQEQYIYPLIVFLAPRDNKSSLLKRHVGPAEEVGRGYKCMLQILHSNLGHSVSEDHTWNKLQKQFNILTYLFADYTSI